MSGLRKSRRAALGMGALSTLLALSGPARGGEEVELDTLQVTATRMPLAAIDTPAAVVAFEAEDLDRRLVRTVPEAFRYTPGVMVQKTSFGQGSPYLRGFTGFRTLFLIDGIRLNNSVFREGANQYWSTVDPLSIERLELAKGPGSVLYGSDAIGGTVQAMSKGPRGYGPGNTVHARVYDRVATAERSNVAHVEASGTWGEKAGLYLDGSYRNFGSLELGGDDGRAHNTGYGEYGGNLKVEHFLTPNVLLTGAHQALRQDNVPRTHSTIQSIPFAGTSSGTDLQRDLDQQRELSYLQLRASDLGGFVDSLNMSLSLHSQSEKEDRVRSNASRRTAGTDVDTLGAWAQLASATPWGTFSYGFEYYRDFVDSTSSSNAVQGPVADDAAYDLFGLYLQDAIPLGERLDLIGGLRFTFAHVDADKVFDPATGLATSLEDDWAQPTASLRALYKILPGRWTAYTGVSQGFRAPNLSDLTRLDSSRSGEFETPAPDLDPEDYVSLEVGSKLVEGPVDFEASYFYTFIDDMIVRTPTGVTVGGESEVTKRNAGDGYVQGVELSTAWNFARSWTARGAFTWTDGEVDTYATSAPIESREPIDRLMPITTILGLRWQPSVWPVWSEVMATFAENQDRLSPGDAADTQRIPPGGTPGYEVVSLYAGWNVTDTLTLTAALENLGDAAYRVHGSGTNEPGRSFVMSINATY